MIKVSEIVTIKKVRNLLKPKKTLITYHHALKILICQIINCLSNLKYTFLSMSFLTKKLH